MGSKQKRKRERNKRRKKSAAPPPANSQSQGFALGPLEVVQEGPTLSFSVDPDHPDYAKFKDALDKQARTTPERVLELRKEIAEISAPYHAFDVVFAVWMTFAVVRTDTLRALKMGFPRAAEYVAHVLLDRDNPQGVRLPTPEEMRTSFEPNKLGELVAQIVADLPIWFHYRQNEDDEVAADPWLELRTRFYLHRLGITSFRYEWQETATIAELFGPFEEELQQDIGFGAEEAIRMAEALASLAMTRAADRGEKARGFAKDLREELAAARRGEAIPNGMLPERMGELMKLPKADAEKWIDGLAMSWMAFGLGQDASFEASDLAIAADVSVDAATAFLNAFAVDFGHRPDKERWEADPHKEVGNELEVMRRIPLLHDGNGGYLPAAIDTVFYGVRDVLTDALKGTANWNRFDRHRADALETRAVKALQSALSPDWAHTGVKFRYTTEGGEEQKGEADGVIRVGTLLVLVESKAGSLAPSARRTAPARLERGLKDLVVAAHEQLGHSYAAFAEGRASEIRDSDGNALALDLEGIQRTLRIAVSLEDLSPVAPAIWQLQEVGLFPADERMPWVVGIHELELICELSESPGQLVHYILRRLRASGQHLWGLDEMDFFMKYLKDGLYFEDAEVEGRSIDLHGFTDALDAYLYGERGMRKKTKRPKQKIDSGTRRLLDDIASIDSPGQIEAQLMILEMDEESRKRVSSELRNGAALTRRDGKSHDRTLLFENDFAVSIHTVPPEQEGELPKRLRNHGQGRSAKSNLRRWLGLGFVVETSKPQLAAMTVMLDPTRLED